MSLTMNPRSATSAGFSFSLWQDDVATPTQVSSVSNRSARITASLTSFLTLGPSSGGAGRRGQALRPVGCVIQERRQHDGVLFQIVDDDPLGGIHVRVVLAHVVVLVVL